MAGAFPIATVESLVRDIHVEALHALAERATSYIPSMPACERDDCVRTVGLLDVLVLLVPSQVRVIIVYHEAIWSLCPYHNSIIYGSLGRKQEGN